MRAFEAVFESKGGDLYLILGGDLHDYNFFKFCKVAYDIAPGPLSKTYSSSLSKLDLRFFISDGY